MANDEVFGGDPARPLRTPLGTAHVGLSCSEHSGCTVPSTTHRRATHLASLGLPTPSIELDALYGLRLPAGVY